MLTFSEFATEINLRRASKDSLTLKIIPDPKRHRADQERLQASSESISNFDELPDIIKKAGVEMGIDDEQGSGKAFTQDVLSIDILGPDRPLLSLVDLPGLIQNATKSATSDEVKMVHAITDEYIKRSRTICLAV